MPRSRVVPRSIIAKQRHGATGTVTLHFDREFTRFSDMAYEDQRPAYSDD